MEITASYFEWWYDQAGATVGWFVRGVVPLDRPTTASSTRRLPLKEITDIWAHGEWDPMRRDASHLTPGEAEHYRESRSPY